jgi:ABC-type thiamin/hydroxymethylpyrimidine transport system permease subunit
MLTRIQDNIIRECMTLAGSRVVFLIVVYTSLSALSSLFFSSRGFGQSATRKKKLWKKHTSFKSGFFIVDLVTRLVSGGLIACT